MRALWQVPLMITVAATAAAAGSERTLTATYPVAAVQRVAIQAGAGDVAIQATDEPSVRIDVELTPRRGGIFASLASSEREVSEAKLEAEVTDGTLHLTVTPNSGDRRFEEDWTVRMPSQLALRLKLGVGDVTVNGLGSGLELDLGVGDATIQVDGGDLQVKLGVGDAHLVAPAAVYGPVAAAGGIGDASIVVEGRQIEGTGMVGHTASWSGKGSHRLKADVGVGDVKVRLE